MVKEVIGMAKPYAKSFYNSKAWKGCRASYIATIYDKMCERCHRELGYIVDHIKEITPENIHDPNITLNHSNLQYLCVECHNVKTFQKHNPLRDDVKFDENGDLVQR